MGTVKLKKRVKPGEPANKPQQLFPDPPPEVLTPQQRVSAAEQLRAACRGFRLRFWDLGQQKRLDDAKITSMATQLNMSPEQLSATKKLYARHPAVTAKNSAKGALEKVFHARTLPFPEPGVRLYPLKSKFDPTWETAKIEQVFAEELSSFSRDIERHIDEFRKSVLRLRDEWPKVLQAAREQLRDEYDPRLYPTPEQLAAQIGCEFRAYNLALPPEYAYVDPVVRQREMAILQTQFQAAAEKQAEVVQLALDEAITQFVNSIRGFTNGQQRTFKTSVVENVFREIEEFKTKCLRFGILDGTKVHEAFDRAMRVMRGGGEDAETATKNLRDKVELRKNVLERMSEVSQALLEASEPVRRRRLEAVS